MDKHTQKFLGYGITPGEIKTHAENLRVIPCGEWGAEPAQSDPAPGDNISQLVLHHMVMGAIPGEMNRPPAATPAEAYSLGCSLARACQQVHFGVGDSDTGQQLTNTRDGLLFEGRHGSATAFDDPKAYFPVGAQNYMHNSTTIGMEHEGNYMEEIPPRAQLLTTLAVIYWLRIRRGWATASLTGHRDWIADDCPGDCFYALLPAIRQLAHEAALLGLGGQ